MRCVCANCACGNISCYGTKFGIGIQILCHDVSGPGTQCDGTLKRISPDVSGSSFGNRPAEKASQGNVSCRCIQIDIASGMGCFNISGTRFSSRCECALGNRYPDTGSNGGGAFGTVPESGQLVNP